ncbi:MULTISPECIES: hypothetical protein [unclassified Pseudomonas]|uniref:hypothetical protein n=1 Tax=unclassified Pseudomonas TaxID=196821 RepID=UPI0021BB7CAA|nr:MULTISPECIES: hypothetical protein [unclassified Pseudomonas]MCT8167457.1 hypothetical protein [Pseudomonas sp. HD6422]MCT8186369.1 hypothetical protein [Pseudomonas sp. HD6421]
MQQNFEAISKSVKNNPEALAAIWSSSLGLLGSGIEAIGLGIHLTHPTRPAIGNGLTISAGTRIAIYGAGIAALAGIMDSALYAFAANRTYKQADTLAAVGYAFALGASAGAVFSGTAALFISALSSFLLGISAAASLAAFAFGFWAKNNESTLLETWARHCRWGLPSDKRLWLSPTAYDEMIGALNAAALGVESKVSINIRFSQQLQTNASSPSAVFINDGANIPAEFVLSYIMRLPYFTPNKSRYHWLLNLHRAGVNAESASLNWEHPNPIPKSNLRSASNKIFSTSEQPKPIMHYDSEAQVLLIHGDIPLREQHNLHAVELVLSYWPDALDESAAAVITIKENRFSKKDALE